MLFTSVGYLAVLHNGLREGFRQVADYGKGRLALLDGEGGAFDPVAREPPDTGVLGRPRIFSGQTLRRQLRGEFDFRRSLSALVASDHVLTVRHPGTDEMATLDLAALDALGRDLAWPVAGEDDPILDHLADLVFPYAMECVGGSGPAGRPRAADAVCCPLDGPVTPVVVEIRSPPQTWQMLCGRAWEADLCPACWLRLSIHLTKMN